MKLLHILSLLLVALVAFTSAQQCPRNPSCIGARNVGRRGRRCRPRTTWHYDAQANQCREMRFLGCRGNNNRWCSRAACEERCRRR